ncbi:hypothetical protein Pla163_03200 [Planctomycetes bacterium Pla163]|uniref:Uncharacterized protein n=1 Tax=Rohdeia mirabilis TaxID=2528008 RepID=A0A518CVG7_9BACT|nr:hypothetical protein Pla163_03200 [Planctomycetes bacterium Pla163]
MRGSIAARPSRPNDEPARPDTLPFTAGPDVRAPHPDSLLLSTLDVGHLEVADPAGDRVEDARLVHLY